MAYTIEINLGGDIVSQLSAIEAKLRSIKSLSNSIRIPNAGTSSTTSQTGILGADGRVIAPSGITVPAPSKSTNIPQNRGAATGTYASGVGTNRPREARQFYEIQGTRQAFGGLGQLALGDMRGFQQIGQGISTALAPALSKAVSAAIATPQGAAILGATGIALAPLAMTAGISAVGKSTYNKFNNMLFDERMSAAIQNLTLMRFAERAVGGGDGALEINNIAQRLQDTWGLPKGVGASAVQQFAAFSGGSLSMGGQIAETVAKLSAVSGAPIDKLIVNTSQLLANQKANRIDVREQVKNVRQIMTYAQDAMKKQGITGDPLAWLSQRGNMLATMFAVARDVEMPAAGRARGIIKGAEQEAWTRIAGNDNFWAMFAQTVKPTFGAFASSMGRQMNMWEQNPALFNEIITTWSQFSNQMAEILPRLGLVFSSLTTKLMGMLGIELPNTMVNTQRSAALTQLQKDVVNQTASESNLRAILGDKYDPSLQAQYRYAMEQAVSQSVTDDYLRAGGILDPRRNAMDALSRFTSTDLGFALNVAGKTNIYQPRIRDLYSQLGGFSNDQIIAAAQNSEQSLPSLVQAVQYAIKSAQGRYGTSYAFEQGKFIEGINNLGYDFSDIPANSRERRSNVEEYFANTGTSVPLQKYYSNPMEKAAGAGYFTVMNTQSMLGDVNNRFLDSLKGTVDPLKNVTDSTGYNVQGNVNRQVYINFNAPLAQQEISISTGASAGAVADAIRDNRDEVGLRSYAIAMQNIGAIVNARGM